MRKGKYQGNQPTIEEMDILYKAEELICPNKLANLSCDEDYTTFNFKPEWNVRITYPYGHKHIRFTIEYKEKWVSVYLDTATRWSMHYEAVTDTELKEGRWYMEEKDEMMKWIEEYLSDE